MKRALSVLLLLSLFILPVAGNVYAEDYWSLAGIPLDSTTEEIIEIYGENKPQKMGNTLSVLIYGWTLIDEDATFTFYFDNDHLYKVFIELDNEITTDEADAFLKAYTDEYGTPIRTAFKNINKGSIEEDPEGDAFYWEISDTMCIYMRPFDIRVSFTVQKIKKTNAESHELLFKGIPWGSDMPTVVSQITETSFNDPQNDYAVSTSRNCLDKGDFFGYDIGVDTYSSKSVNVAGYSARISLGFAHKPGSNGLLTHKKEDTAFTYAKYYIQHEDARFAMSDLKEKLTKLYGEPNHKNTNYVIEYDIYYWEGDNGTIISLMGEFYSSGSTEVTIIYSFYGADDLYNKAQEALNLEERLNTDKDDLTGL